MLPAHAPSSGKSKSASDLCCLYGVDGSCDKDFADGHEGLLFMASQPAPINRPAALANLESEQPTTVCRWKSFCCGPDFACDFSCCVRPGEFVIRTAVATVVHLLCQFLLRSLAAGLSPCSLLLSSSAHMSLVSFLCHPSAWSMV